MNIAFTLQGKCACGKDAHMLVSKLLAHDKQTTPVPICDECNLREMQDMVRRANQLTREEALEIKRKYFE